MLKIFWVESANWLFFYRVLNKSTDLKPQYSDNTNAINFYNIRAITQAGDWASRPGPVRSIGPHPVSNEFIAGPEHYWAYRQAVYDMNDTYLFKERN